jgi:hypothetical protein
MARPLPTPPPLLMARPLREELFFGFPEEGSCKLIRQSISSMSVHYKNSKELWTELEWVICLFVSKCTCMKVLSSSSSL